jgi:ribA/ribD-fused uncharacterized protein
MTIRFFSKSQTHREFSNFAPFPIDLDGKRWPSVEHFYQAQKFADPELQQKIRKAEKPAIAKSLADKYKAAIRPDWYEVKEAAMERAVRRKFELYPELRALLLATSEEALAEAARGIGRDGNGQNKLGLLLMRLRVELRGASPSGISAKAGIQ